MFAIASMKKRIYGGPQRTTPEALLKLFLSLLYFVLFYWNIYSSIKYSTCGCDFYNLLKISKNLKISKISENFPV